MGQVKIFDEGHEKDLEESINKFLKENKDIIINDIQYRTSHFQSNDEQIFSFSVMIIYRVKGDIDDK